MSPVYNIRCEDCGKEFEKYITYDEINEELEISISVFCPKCGSKNTHRLISHKIPVIYKAEGFTKKISKGGQ